LNSTGDYLNDIGCNKNLKTKDADNNDDNDESSTDSSIESYDTHDKNKEKIL